MTFVLAFLIIFYSINRVCCSSKVVYNDPTLTAIPPCPDQFCVEMQFTHTSLSILPNDTFLTYPKLVKLYLNDNKIHHIDEGAFNGLLALQILDLKNNELFKLPVSMGTIVQSLQSFDMRYVNSKGIRPPLMFPYFSDFRNLRYLTLSNMRHNIFNVSLLPLGLAIINLANTSLIEFPNFASRLSLLKGIRLAQNNMTSIPYDFIKSLNRMQTISVYENNLQHIPDISFMTSLYQLYVHGNQLQTVPDLYDLPLTKLKIGNNPLACNQSLCWIRMWPWFKTPALSDKPRCGTPDFLQGIRLMDIPPETLQCYKGDLIKWTAWQWYHAVPKVQYGIVVTRFVLFRIFTIGTPYLTQRATDCASF